MALNPHVSAARRAAMLDTITSAASSGKLRIYSGSQPADADATIGAATLLAELTMGATAFGSATSTASTNSVLTANAITSDTSADATGTAAWFRLWQSNGTTPILDGTVGTSGTDLIINSTAIQIGATVSASSLTLTLAV
jgi:hypothetical protein